MKKLALISVCVLSLALAGSAATSGSINGKTPVKKEVPASKKAHAKKTKTKKAAVAHVTPAAPVKK